MYTKVSPEFDVAKKLFSAGVHAAFGCGSNVAPADHVIHPAASRPWRWITCPSDWTCA